MKTFCFKIAPKTALRINAPLVQDSVCRIHTAQMGRKWKYIIPAEGDFLKHLNGGTVIVG